MDIREEIVQKYNELYRILHNEFFETINVGTPYQERRLKLNMSSNEFNTRYANLEQSYKAELIAAGFIETPIEPPRDLAAEIDDLKARVEKLEKM